MSCPRANFCAAVGIWLSAGPLRHSFIEQWNGTSWRIVPSTPRGRENYLQGVSCTVTRACTAVGFGTGNDGSYRTMVEERAAGGQWALVPSPNRSFGDQLYSVDCTGTHACVGAGSIVIARDAEGWSRQRTPFDDNSYVEYGMSCVSASACQIVGGPGPVAMRWDGTRWREQPSARLADGGTLLAVDCVAADSRIAVGEQTELDQGQFPYPVPLAQKWDGTTWTQVPTP